MRLKHGSGGRRRWLGTPKLVRETSRRHWWQRGGPEKSVEDVKRDFSDIVLPPSLQAPARPRPACDQAAGPAHARRACAAHSWRGSAGQTCVQRRVLGAGERVALT